MKATASHNDVFQFLRPFNLYLWILIHVMVIIFAATKSIIKILDDASIGKKCKRQCFMNRQMAVVFVVVVVVVVGSGQPMPTWWVGYLLVE